MNISKQLTVTAVELVDPATPQGDRTICAQADGIVVAFPARPSEPPDVGERIVVNIESVQ